MLTHLPLRLLLVVCATAAYNLDVDNLHLFRYPGGSGSSRASYFGFSVALIGKDGLLVGAPRANSTLPGGRSFDEPGVVYMCFLKKETDGYCEQANMDTWYNTTRVFRSRFVSQKRDHAWFGATLNVVEESTSDITRVVICAPRWKQDLFDGIRSNWYMNGMCLSLLSSYPTNRYHHVPLLDGNHQVIEFHRDTLYFYGMGQAGFSAVATSSELVVGAPGMFYWTGTALQLGERSLRDQQAGLIPKVIGDSRLETHGYFGYSITSGFYYKRSERLYAAGAPRSSNILGKVFIFAFPRRSEEKLVYRAEFLGEQHGEYFGASLASCDVNGDGRDDLLVGAPLWGNDEGRVYVHVSKGQTAFEIQRIDGKTAGGRFGTSITCLGDLDRDGYADVAIGAPYEHRGVVYVYNGNAEGRLEMTQFIRAPRDEMRGFGTAISEPRDMDGNGYNDIAVGAPLSGHVVVLKSRAVVVIHMKLKVDEKFALTDNSTEFYVNVCARYDGAEVSDTFNVTVELTIDKLHKRALVYHKNRIFVDTFKFSTTLRRGEEKCVPVKITLKKNNDNMIDPIDLLALIFGNDPTSQATTPVINPILSRIVDDLQLPYSLDCGDDDVCVPELHVDVKTDNESNEVHYTVGSRSSLNVSVLVMNKGEAAYAARAHVLVPEPIVLARIPPECDEVEHPENRTIEVVCNVGHPLRYTGDNGVKTLVMELDMSAVQFTDEFSIIYVKLTTQSQFAVEASMKIVYKNDADLTIIGKSYDEWYSYSAQDVVEENPRLVTFNHVYEILKFGVSPVQEAQLALRVPTRWRDLNIAQIVQIQGTVDGHEYECENITEEEMWNATSTAFSSDTLQYSNEGNGSLVVSPAGERTFYVNCTDKEVTCEEFRCSLGSFVKPQSAAKLTVTIDFRISKLIVQAVKGKDVIFFVTEGFVKIIQPNIAIVSSMKKPDYKQIATVLFSRREPEKVAIWIIILSVLLGIILLSFLTFLLFKLGFFNRTRAQDREALKPKETSENMHGNENSGTNIERESTDGT